MSGTKDTNYESHVLEKGQSHMGHGWAAPVNPLSYDDIKKLSQCEDTSLNYFKIPGGREDCVDVVRGRNVTINECILEPNGKRAITLKGSLDGFTINRTVIQSGAKDTDIEVGQFDNYWYPGRKPTRCGRIYELNHNSQHTVRIRLWDATDVNIQRSNVKITRVPKFIWFPYFLWRYVVVRCQGIRTK